MFLLYQAIAALLFVASFTLGVKAFLFSYAVLFHLSLIISYCPFWLYIWFVMSWYHYYIHAYKCKRTPIESKKISADEFWHVANQIMVLFYLYCYRFDSSNSIKLYFCSFILYLITLTLFWNKYKFYRHPYYYISSLMALFFMLIVEKMDMNILNVCLTIVPQVVVTWMISFQNKFGRMLIRTDAAGCAFIAELLVLYAHQNNTLSTFKNFSVLFS